MGNWTSVSEIKLSLSSTHPECSIYANGRNRVLVQVTVCPTDDHSKQVTVDPTELANSIKLIDYNDETELTFNGKSGWCVTNEPNEYTGSPSDFSDIALAAPRIRANEAPSVTLYVYVSSESNPKSIGASVKPTDGEKTILCSKNGTYHSSVTINPSTPVKYGKEDVSMQRGPDQILEDGTTLQSMLFQCTKASYMFIHFEIYNFDKAGDDAGDCGPLYTKGSQMLNAAIVWRAEPHTERTANYVTEFGGKPITLQLGKVYACDDPAHVLWFTDCVDSPGWKVEGLGRHTNPQVASANRNTVVGATWWEVYDQYGNMSAFELTLLESAPRLNFQERAGSPTNS